jgi:N-acetylglucosaminyl-diphospho-decaprenol L-rhamnosyltransferase
MTEPVAESRQGVDVVIVACNSGALLEDCVARVLMAERCASVCLFDNASDDGWPKRVAHRFSGDARFSLLVSERNLGFGSGCNRAAAERSGPWVLFLNPDCLVEQDTLTELLAIVEAHADIGVLGADVRDALGRDESAARRRSPTPIRLLHDQLPMLGIHSDGVHQARSSERVQAVDACSGALMLMPRSVFERTGRFDEAFFLHGEDLDLCARVRAAGLRVAVANEVRVVHRQGSSSKARPVFVAWHKHLGLGRYLLRHHAESGLQRVLIIAGIAAAFLFRGLPGAWMSRSQM